MREFSFSIKPYLDAGLRPVKRNLAEDEKVGSVRSRPGLVDAYNCRVRSGGLEPFRPVILPFTQDTLSAEVISVAWPGPQLFKGKGVTLLVDRNRLWYVNEADWSLWRVLTFYDASDTNSTASIKVGNQWQFSDMWDAWMLHNGISTLIHSNRFNMLGETDKILVAGLPRVQAGCYYKGRTWMGGFDSDYFFSTGWKAFYEDWASRLSVEYDTSMTALGESSAWWSTIGGGDCMALFFSLTDFNVGLTTASYGSTRPLLFEYLKRNETGSRALSWQGKVLTVKPLGNHVMYYGEGGVSALSANSAIVGETVLPIKHGIHNVGSVGGDENEHILFDRSGTLWHIDRNLEVRKLDYREQMASLLGTEVIISFSTSEREWYICNGLKGYVLTNEGLCEHGQVVITSVIEAEGNNLGFCTHVDAMDKEMRIKTDTIDMRERGIKTAAFLDVFTDIPEHSEIQPNIKVGVDYRYSIKKAFKSSREIPINTFGTARVGVSGSDLRVFVKADDFRFVNIEDVVFRYQVPDRRFVRGTSVQQT